MFSNEEILKMLRDGKSADEIAKSMSDALNNANKTYEAEKKAKEAAEKKLAEEREAKAIRETEKIEYLDGILDDLDDWFAEYYDGVSPFEDVMAEDIISLFDKCSDFCSLFTSSVLKDGDYHFFSAKNDNGKVSTKSSNKKIDADSIIDEFLKELGL